MLRSFSIESYKSIRRFSSVIGDIKTKNKEKASRVSHSIRLTKYLGSKQHLSEIRKFIPKKYLLPRRLDSIENLYLIDEDIARSIARFVLPFIWQTEQVICETNPGFGLVTEELLDCNIPLVRLYECCPEFRTQLRDFNEVYKSRIELFVKDIFQMSRFSVMDKFDNSNRVQQLLRGIPNKKWEKGPAITIIGTMPKPTFIFYLMKMLVLQAEIVTCGQTQLFALMRPGDFLKLTAGPEQNLHTYQWSSVLFNLLFDYEMLESYPRKVFLPWETKSKITSRTKYFKTFNSDQIYLVRIKFKDKLPVEVEDLLTLYTFVKQSFGRGNNKIIPTIEKWIPGCGLNLIAPSLSHKKYPKNITIYSTFGELNPHEILCLFKEMIHHPNYNNSSFKSMMESEVLKSETIETCLDDVSAYQKEVVEDLEEKLNL